VAVGAAGEVEDRDESGSGRIIPLPHPHLYIFVGCGAERILHRRGYECGFFRMSDKVQSRIGAERMNIVG
jgi:hypothetical protein